MQHSNTYELMTKRSLHIDYGRCQYIITFKSDSAEVKIRPDFAKNTFEIIILFKLIIIHYNTQKQKKIKFEPRITLNHNIYIYRP